MKHMIVAAVVLLCCAGTSSAQFALSVRSGGVLVGGPQVRLGIQRGPVFIAGGISRGVVVANPYAFAPIWPTQINYAPVWVAPSPNITVNNFYAGGLPILGPGYDNDIRGVNLDRVPMEKKAPAAVAAPKAADKPLPGVDVSKLRPSVRPDEPTPAKKPAPKPPKAAGPLDEQGLIELGLSSFRDGEYGLAAQRFRQAAKVAPNAARVRFLLSQAEFANGHYRDAVAAIHEGMKLDKAWSRSQQKTRADLYLGKESEYSELINRLTDAVAANPDQPTLLFLLAHQLWFDGQRKDAVTLLHRARPLTNDKMFVDAFLAAGAGA